MTKLAAPVLALLVIMVLLAVNLPTTPGTPAAGRRRHAWHDASATAPVPLQPLRPCDWTLETAQRELASGRNIVFTSPPDCAQPGDVWLAQASKADGELLIRGAVEPRAQRFIARFVVPWSGETGAGETSAPLAHCSFRVSCASQATPAPHPTCAPLHSPTYPSPLRRHSFPNSAQYKC